MHLKTLIHPTYSPLPNPSLKKFHSPPFSQFSPFLNQPHRFYNFAIAQRVRVSPSPKKHRRFELVTSCKIPNRGEFGDELDFSVEYDITEASISEENVVNVEEMEEQRLRNQMSNRGGFGDKRVFSAEDDIKEASISEEEDIEVNVEETEEQSLMNRISNRGEFGDERVFSVEYDIKEASISEEEEIEVNGKEMEKQSLMNQNSNRGEFGDEREFSAEYDIKEASISEEEEIEVNVEEMEEQSLRNEISNRGEFGDERDFSVEYDIKEASISSSEEEEIEVDVEEMEEQSLWNQMKEIVLFSGPATGLWICGPLMSLIDTAVIGQGSSIELAALGPGTVLCDYIGYTFMFLSIATSNTVAIALARQDKKEVQHQISIMLFVGFACGLFMLLFTKFFGEWALAAFTGEKNMHLVPAANTYVQIRGLAWPAILVGWVAQSASLGMKDSWGPLKALAVASAVNGIGDIVLCTFLGYGIAGAAWATMASQIIAAYMMMQALNKRGYNAFALSIPSRNELLQIIQLAAPVFITMMSKVLFYSLLIYFATSMGTHTVAAHQVMLQIYSMCTVWGEPLSQTAQSFMPELIYGIHRNLSKARRLLKTLLIIGAIFGVSLGIIGTCVPWFFPNVFTSDPAVMKEMHQVLIPYFLALSITSCTHSLEGTLLAGRELTYISISMTGCFILGGVVQLLLTKGGYGLPGCWYSLVGFQWARFFMALRQLLSSDGILYSDNPKLHEPGKLKVV